MVVAYQQEMDDFRFNRALEEVWKVISLANKYIVSNAPWEMVKDEENKQHLPTVFYTLLESLRILAVVLEPVMPATSAKMNGGLGVDNSGELSSRSQWGQLQVGAAIAKPEPLFPRLDKKKNKANKGQDKQAASKKQQKKEKLEGVITFEQFGQVELRVAEVMAAEKVKKSDRLLKLIVHAPEERTIVAGIAEHYGPEDLVGRQVIIVANLQPAKLMGITSEGMVLAAKDGDRLVLSGLSDKVANGSKVA